MTDGYYTFDDVRHGAFWYDCAGIWHAVEVLKKKGVLHDTLAMCGHVGTVFPGSSRPMVVIRSVRQMRIDGDKKMCRKCRNAVEQAVKQQDAITTEG